MSKGRLIIDGTAVYELDEKCMLTRKLGEVTKKRSDQREQKRIEERMRYQHRLH